MSEQTKDDIINSLKGEIMTIEAQLLFAKHQLFDTFIAGRKSVGDKSAMRSWANYKNKVSFDER